MPALHRSRSMLNVLRPEVQPRLYEFYDLLRNEDELRWDGSVRGWLATSYDVVAELAADLSLSSTRFPSVERAPDGIKPLAKIFKHAMLYMDDPGHARLRALVARAFTPRAIAGFRSRVEEIVDGLLAAPLSNGRMEVMEDFAQPLPVAVICEMLGVPTSDRMRMKTWSADVMLVLGNSNLGLTGQDLERATSSLEAAVDYLEWLLGNQAVDSDALLPRMVEVAEDGSRLGQPELIANALLLIVAGHETTTNLIGNGLLALLQDGDAYRRLLGQPDLIGTAVEELVRFDSPIQLLLRRATEDRTIRERPIKRGQLVLLAIGAANRDPAAFARPDALDFSRQGRRQIAFGHGAHYCLGAALARLEGEIAFHHLLTRLPDLRLNGEVEWHPNLSLRGLKRLDVVFS